MYDSNMIMVIRRSNTPKVVVPLRPFGHFRALRTPENASKRPETSENDEKHPKTSKKHPKIDHPKNDQKKARGSSYLPAAPMETPPPQPRPWPWPLRTCCPATGGISTVLLLQITVNYWKCPRWANTWCGCTTNFMYSVDHHNCSTTVVIVLAQVAWVAPGAKGHSLP